MRNISGDADFENTLLYTGREYDKEIGLYFYRARYYDPELGRFISQDPIGIEDDINLYAYVGNNPVNFTDPSGEKAKRIIISGGKLALEVSGLLVIGEGVGAGTAFWVGYFTDDQYLRDTGVEGLMNVKDEIYTQAMIYGTLGVGRVVCKAGVCKTVVKQVKVKLLVVGNQVRVYGDDAYRFMKNAQDGFSKLQFVRLEVLDTGFYKFPKVFIDETAYQQTKKEAQELAMKNAGKVGGGIIPSKSNYRALFDKYYGTGPFKMADGTVITNRHRHHAFPQEYEPDFAFYGINVHDPRFITPVESTVHLKFSNAYNAKWKIFFENAEKLKWSSETVKKEAEILAKQFAKENNYLYPYPVK